LCSLTRRSCSSSLPGSSLLVPPPPLLSPLFPYPTLFRSRAWSSPRLFDMRDRERPESHALGREARGNIGLVADRTACRAAAPVPDRKSTRLNSSHVKISYAVLCLKQNTSGALGRPIHDCQ